MQQNKNTKKKYLKGENYQGDLQQGNYLGGQTRDTIRNIEGDWRGIGDGEKESNQKKEKWKKSQKKRKLRKKNQKLESGQKKMMMRQATWLTHTTSYRRKIPQDKET